MEIYAAKRIEAKQNKKRKGTSRFKKKKTANASDGMKEKQKLMLIRIRVYHENSFAQTNGISKPITNGERQERQRWISHFMSAVWNHKRGDKATRQQQKCKKESKKLLSIWWISKDSHRVSLWSGVVWWHNKIVFKFKFIKSKLMIASWVGLHSVSSCVRYMLLLFYFVVYLYTSVKLQSALYIIIIIVTLTLSSKIHSNL